MSLVETEASLDKYIEWIKDDLIATSRTRADCLSLDIAIEKYGLEKVRQAIEPTIPEIIETICTKWEEFWSGDGETDKRERQLYRDFRKAYNDGEEINIGPIVVKKKD